MDALRRELQGLKEREKELREQYDAQLAEKDRINAELSAEIQRLLDEYRVYINEKVALDAEINTYRILLEVGFLKKYCKAQYLGRGGAS